MNSKITLKSTVSRIRDLVSTELDDETILMSIEKGSYYGMEKTARRIWELLETPQSVSGMIDILSDEYSVAPQECEQDILDYLQELSDEGLIVVKQ